MEACNERNMYAARACLDGSHFFSAQSLAARNLHTWQLLPKPHFQRANLSNLQSSDEYLLRFDSHKKDIPREINSLGPELQKKHRNLNNYSDR